MARKSYYHNTDPESFHDGKGTYKDKYFEVSVMVIVDKYAMVRRPRCYPFVVPAEKLCEDPPKEKIS